MSNTERLLEQQAKHLEHLQMRIDMVQASADAIASLVTLLVAQLPPVTDGNTQAKLNALISSYVKSRQSGTARLSEFPFEPPPLPPE